MLQVRNARGRRLFSVQIGPWRPVARQHSLRRRLAAGAAALTLGTLVTALVLFLGMTRVVERLDSALAAEARMARYSMLSTQVSSFLVIATEAVQTGLPASERRDRVQPVVENMRRTFALLDSDNARAVAEVEALGLEQQSRHATQSLLLARMRAQLDAVLRGLSDAEGSAEVLRAHLNSFASTFDPLLNQAVNAEGIFRGETLAGIARLRGQLSLAALVMAGVAVALAIAFYTGLIHPQFRRLDRLRDAARRIGQEDFAIALPVTRSDEIGLLYAEINRMAAALGARQERVQQDRARLNETIAQQTAELRAANAALERIDANRRRFFADVSHELRTPLTVILVEAQIGQQATPEAAEAFATIETRAARLNRRIDDLLRVARSDSGELGLDPAPVGAAEVLRDVLEEVRAECDNAGLALTDEAAPGLCVLADANWLRQVLAGLVRNAIRHARAGGRVRLSVRQDGAEAVFEVRDNGPGIAEDRQDTVLRRFARGSASQAEGFGIGLSLAAWVAEAHGGRLALRSPLSRGEALGEAPGLAVSLRLPLAERDADSPRDIGP